MAKKIEDRKCPYCKEEINPEAIKCKHCHSSIAPEKSDHGGTCPYCKEEINAEAIKCKHCQSSLIDKPLSECGCGKGTLEPDIDSLAFRAPSFPGQGLIGGGSVFAPPQFNCNPLFCSCRGDNDCNDMFGSGICNGRSICYETTGRGLTCFCLR